MRKFEKKVWKVVFCVMLVIILVCPGTLALGVSGNRCDLNEREIFPQNLGNIITVDDEPGDADYTRIQEAIYVADPGDTILVYGGLYYEKINLYKLQLRLEGVNDQKDKQPVPIIGSTGSFGSIIVEITADYCVFEGFKIVSDLEKLAIQVKSNGNIIENNTILNSYIGIEVREGFNNLIFRNTIMFSMIGVCLCSSSNEIRENNFLGNRYCIELYRSFSSTIFGNSFSGYQKGIVLTYDFPISTGCVIHYNNFLSINPFSVAATFKNCLKADWNRNYWNRPRLLPRLILGKVEYAEKGYPWPNLDWRPLEIPYRIGTGTSYTNI